MSDAKWRSATIERPCPECGKANRCRIAPDGTAVVCWRNGGKVIQRGNPNGNGHRPSYSGAVPRKPQSNGKTFPTADAVIAATGARIPGGKWVATWAYADASGADTMCVARFDIPGGKEFRPVHRIGDKWRIGDPPGPLPLYRIHELPLDGAVFICEGEKATDVARFIGLAAITSAHGSSSASKSDWTALAGRDAVILPDADGPGANYARDVAAILATLDPPSGVKIVNLPGLPDGGDIVEFIDARDSRDADELRGEIEALADAAPLMDADAPARIESAPAKPWPDPLPLPVGLPPVMPFDFALLPVALHGWVKDISERMQCPPDYCAATAMIVAGALIDQPSHPRGGGIW